MMPDQDMKPAESAVVQISDRGKSYQIYLPDHETDYIQGKLAAERIPYERDMLQDMADRLSSGDLVLDIGANIGNHSLYLAAVTGCRVIAFEANEALARALERSVALNGFGKRVRVQAQAVGEQSGLARFAEARPDNLGAQTLVVDAAGGTVPVIALDEARLRKRVRMIKIDVEGMETAVLQGARQLITRDRPVLYIETATESDFHAVQREVSRQNYVLWDTFNATPTHLFLPAETVKPEAHLHHVTSRAVLDRFRHTADVKALRAQLSDANLKYRTVTAQLTEARQAHDAAQAQGKDLATALEEAQSRAAGLETALQTQGERIAALETTEESLTARLAAEQDQAGRIAAELAEARQARDAAQAQGKDLATALETTERTLTARLVAEQEQGRQRSQELTEARKARNAALAHGNTLALALEAARAAVSDEADATHQRSADLARRLDESEARLRAAERRAETAEARIVEARIHERIEERQAGRLAEPTAGPVMPQGAGQNTRQGLPWNPEQRPEPDSPLTPAIIAGWTAALDLPGATLATRWMTLARALKPHYPEQTRALLQVLAARQDGSLSGGPEETRLARELGIALIEEGLAAEGLRILEPMAGTLNLSSRETRLLVLARNALAQGQTDPGTLRHKASRVVRSRLRLATIMDEFTALGYAPECDLQQLSVGNWHTELEDFAPDLVLIESAWRGLNEEWGPRVGQISAEVRGILDWCTANNVPKAFWNKEDPVHFGTFLNLAQKFDLVFTTDIDCIPRYKAALKHDRVHLLPFACQPEHHNPVELAERKPGFCFAGAYYARYPDRTRDLDDFLETLSEHLPFEIFDRNFGKDHPDYMFPEAYRRHIVGTLPPSEIDRAYKGYDFGINLNSVKNSQSMFARRVYELLASNTRVVSNFSPGLRRMFGDLVIATDSGAEALRRIRKQDEQATVPRLRLAALRKVLTEHTYSHRIGRIVRLAGLDVPDPAALPPVVVCGQATDSETAGLLLAAFRRQTLPGVRFVLVVPPSVDLASVDLASVDLAGAVLPETLRCLSPDEAGALTLSDLVGPGQWLAGFVPEDYYGPHYLTDLMLATRYSAASAFGKAAHHRLEDGQPVAVSGPIYRPVEALALRRAVLRGDRLEPGQPLSGWLAALPGPDVCTETGRTETGALLALDPFGYCENGARDAALLGGLLDDPAGINPGIAGPALEAIGDALAPAPAGEMDETQRISAAALARSMVPPASGKLTWSVRENGDWQIDSRLGNEEHVYIYANQSLPLGDVSPGGAPFPVHPLVGPGLNLLFVVVWQDAARQKIDHQIFASNANTLLTPPEGTAFFRIGIRPRGPGSCTLHGIKLAEHFPPPRPVISDSRVLVLTNHYPSYQDLYRNGFLHSRVRSYRELGGITPDVYRLRPDQDLSWHEFQNIDVMTGSAEQLDFLLASGRYDHVLVHFLDPAMWAVLQRHIDRIRVTVWVHGAEVQPWWRRAFNYSTDEERAKAREASDERLAFWRGLFAPLPKNLQFVFVSRYFADEVFEDLEVTCPPGQYQIIHNPIDDGLFAYHEKPVEQRGKILSIRPFASRVYANDQTVKAILALQRRDFFDQLEFRIIGDGPLFDEITAPLAGIPNVIVERGFLLQSKIAELHRDYGVFLCPSRMDTQGVSRDEAMSSGLVPVTSRVAAIPDFVDERCGYMTEPEDADGLARAIGEMWNNPDIFLRKSRAAAERVRCQSGKDRVIAEELALFAPRKG